MIMTMVVTVVAATRTTTFELSEVRLPMAS
jgi:hypothetical protein